MKRIKLSRDINTNNLIYPSNPRNVITQIDDYKTNGCKTHFLKLFTHNGTHIELPRHFIDGEDDITKYPVDRFIFDNVQVTTLFPMGLEKSKDLLLIKTNSERDNVVYPTLTPNVAEKICNYDYKCIGIDTISIGNINSKKESEEVHKLLFHNNILIIEDLDLSNLHAMPKKVYAIPLFIDGIEASPCTVFAELEE